ncbi:gamma-butyrobetaine hydroxylase-like domain-containing protein [Candidatus Nitrosacidococcus tergens]|uniref:Gamma-butyrobetaine hydroxylase-like N-terminal domain-containing protein n=1 Tax=Candidatus Nitrosacidococcus tergens TaxID=553981 RepID=A0A7G1Q847_9GAMM|nr:DUF971 domain-containing protein [Candidatus Nitrosacidococcus tergens]CAB1274770.1 conserved protein of unknown function [Candidatus Nitrosacidococcus tergens]
MTISQSIPTIIRLHRTSCTLELEFNDRTRYLLPCEFLRVYSPSAEVQGHGNEQRVLLIGKESVTIKNIESVGNYAIRLYFSDGHSTGLYSWKYLYELGEKQEQLWQDYLNRLQQVGYTRRESNTKTITDRQEK